MSLKKRIRTELEDRFGYDFGSEFWTDDNLTMLEEIIEVTKDVVENTL